MTIFEKFLYAWILLIVPISLYGIVEIEKGLEYRWKILGGWELGIFILLIYGIWSR